MRRTYSAAGALAVSAALTIGCGANATLQQAAMPQPTTRTIAVKSSAKQMYRMFLKGDAQGFCRFAAPASVAHLAVQFNKSGMTAQQICVVISAAAFKTFLDDPDNHARLVESLAGVDDVEVMVNGNQAWIGDQDNNTRFQKIHGKWRPIMPSFDLPSDLSMNQDLVQA